MPAFTYPGVYIEEVPSGVRTITGVTTSDTAFVDYFNRGPVGVAVRCTSFADFERRFGGLDSASEASYAISQFFLNGGGVAWVVRVLVERSAEEPPARSTITLKAGDGDDAPDALTVEASSEGDWGNDLHVGVVHVGDSSSTTFDLLVREYEGDRIVTTEMFRRVNAAAGPNFAVTVVNAQSELVTVNVIGDARPNQTEPPDPDNPDASRKAIDELGKADLVPLQGGSSGLEPGLEDWRTNAATALIGSERDKSGIYALTTIAPFVFNLLCIPAAANLDADGWGALYTAALRLCQQQRAFLLVDPPASLNRLDDVDDWRIDDLRAPNAAVYFPRLAIPDPLDGNRPRAVAASGTVAGIFARTDATRGVFKAAAGTTDGRLRGATLTVRLNDREAGILNIQGVNALQTFPVFGSVIWGARTLDGADAQASEWKYVPVRRTALFIEESLFQGLKFAVFEPNGPPLWSQIRLNVGAFMQGLFRQGAFAGVSPREAYLVKCDSETTTQNDVNLGVVNVLVAFAPLRPAEFVVIRLQQLAGQLAT